MHASVTCKEFFARYKNKTHIFRFAFNLTTRRVVANKIINSNLAFIFLKMNYYCSQIEITFISVDTMTKSTRNTKCIMCYQQLYVSSMQPPSMQLIDNLILGFRFLLVRLCRDFLFKHSRMTFNSCRAHS